MSLFDQHDKSFDELYASFKWHIPDRYNIGVDVCDRHVGDKHADKTDAVALYLENAAGDTSTITFGELKTRSNQLANGLQSLGVERGDRVAIVLPQRAETVIAHVAIYKMGAIALPLSVLFGHDALTYRLGDSRARIVITDSTRAPLVAPMIESLEACEHMIVCDEYAGGEHFWDLINNATDAYEPVETSSNDPALLIYTSGTTGPPKGALKAHRSLLGNLPGFELSQNFFPLEDDLMWTPADWAWTGGLMDALLPALRYGVPVLGYDGGRFDAEKSFALMEKYGVRNAFIPPTALKMLMQVKDAPTRFNLKLRAVMTAGETAGAEIVRWADEALDVKVNEMWGQTEFNYLVGNCAAALPTKYGSMGKPYPGHIVDVIDEKGHVLPNGEVGELAGKLGDPVMFIGYWNNEQATKDKIVGKWFRTGDLGYRDQDGYLWFVGRKDDVISSAGHRVGPGEVEDCLLKHPSVAQAAVVGSPDALRGNIIKAFIVLAQGYTGSQELIEDIQSSVKSRLAAHEYPREVEFIDSLPVTTTGKIRRMELRQREIERKGVGN